jgi:hypothetical protein
MSPDAAAEAPAAEKLIGGAKLGRLWPAAVVPRANEVTAKANTRIGFCLKLHSFIVRVWPGSLPLMVDPE